MNLSAKKHDKMFTKVMLAFVFGILYGIFFKDYTNYLELVSTIFVRCIKMVVVPIIFFSLVGGMCSHANQERGMSRLFMKTLIYFEIMSLIAIAITFAAVMYFQPGLGLDTISFSSIDHSSYVKKVQDPSFRSFIFSIFPDNFFATLTHDHLLAVIFLAVISSVAILKIPKNQNILSFVEDANKFFFQLIHLIIGFAPYATFAAIAYSVGHAGVQSLSNLGSLVFVVLLSMLVFCLFLCMIARVFFGIPVFQLLLYIKQEMIVAYATSSSEAVFPQLLEKLESFGCKKRVASFVLPMGYSFNLDGTAIYVTAGALFIQQAYQVPFTPMDYLTLLFILLFTSKGAAGVMGAGFITLSATLAALPGQPIPLEGLAILFGIDRFMSDARTICNVIGNTVGTLIIAKAENAYTMKSSDELWYIEEES